MHLMCASFSYPKAEVSVAIVRINTTPTHTCAQLQLPRSAHIIRTNYRTIVVHSKTSIAICTSAFCTIVSRLLRNYVLIRVVEAQLQPWALEK